jgi:hypothetical protein
MRKMHGKTCFTLKGIVVIHIGIMQIWERKQYQRCLGSGTLGRDGKLETVSAFGVIENPILPALFSLGLGQSTA